MVSGKGLNMLTDTFKYTSKWEFDKESHLTQLISDVNDTLSTIGNYTCDSIGNVIKLKYIFSSHREPDLYYYKYDTQSHMVEKSLNDTHFLLQKSTFRYMAFDPHNNWIKRAVHWQSFSPMVEASRNYVENRKITYY